MILKTSTCTLTYTLIMRIKASGGLLVSGKIIIKKKISQCQLICTHIISYTLYITNHLFIQYILLVWYTFLVSEV